MKKKIKAVLTAFLCMIIVISGGFGLFVSNGYKAENELFIDNTVIVNTETGVTISRLSDGNIVFAPEKARAGLIFYPGGNVEYSAYAPLLEKLSNKGILCVLIKMPFNLAVFDSNAADGIKENYPELEHWCIGGHSLGGAMASTYFKTNYGSFEALILLAAYSTEDLSKIDKKVISIYGSNDGVLNAKKYAQYKSNLPKNTNELIINGGCHSYFGDYGIQKGDGNPTITREEQMNITVDYIISQL